MITVWLLGSAVVCNTSLQTGVYYEKDIELKIKAEPLLLKFIQYVINFILQRFSKVLFFPELLVCSETKVLWELLCYVSVRKLHLLASRSQIPLLFSDGLFEDFHLIQIKY